MADDRDREREGQRVDQVEAGCAVRGRQQPDRDFADPRLESGDGPRGERERMALDDEALRNLDAVALWPDDPSQAV